MEADPVLVVGDSMLDRYGEGAVDRMSPEVPVPVLRTGREWQRAGSAAKVAVNLAGLQRSTTLATLLGDAAAGRQFGALLAEHGVRCTRRAARAWSRRGRSAPSVGEQLLRVDIEQPVPDADAAGLADLLADLAAGAWHGEDGFMERMAALRATAEVEHLLVMRGEQGMTLFSAGARPCTWPPSGVRFTT